MPHHVWWILSAVLYIAAVLLNFPVSFVSIMVFNTMRVSIVATIFSVSIMLAASFPDTDRGGGTSGSPSLPYGDFGGNSNSYSQACDKPRMEKITDRLAALPANSEWFSLEFAPPKTEKGFSNLRDRLYRIKQDLRPLFVAITWRADGSTARSLELAQLSQHELGMTTCLHLTCVNMTRRSIDKALADAKAVGIRNIFALRGDPLPVPRNPAIAQSTEEEEGSDRERFEWAIDLVKYIRKSHGDYFCIGVAAYPEGHLDENNPQSRSLEHDLPYLVDKVQAGADFLITQLFFDIQAYEKFEAILRQHHSGAFATIPILPGLLPIENFDLFERATRLDNATVPPAILDRLMEAKEDEERVQTTGVDILSELIDQVRTVKSRSRGSTGFHFFTFNREEALARVLERTGLLHRKPVAAKDGAALQHLP